MAGTKTNCCWLVRAAIYAAAAGGGFYKFDRMLNERNRSTRYIYIYIVRVGAGRQVINCSESDSSLIRKARQIGEKREEWGPTVQS